jgi:Protein of unknown function
VKNWLASTERVESSYISEELIGMSDSDDTNPDGPLTPEAEARARLLTAADLQHIDDCLLSHTSHRWQKVARVIAATMAAVGHQFPGIPDVFYSLRIKHLVESGAIEAAGDLNRMRHSEVCIPGPKPAGSQ